MRKLLNRLFGLEEINGDGRCPTYLFRWTLLRVGEFAVYLHKFVGDDWSLDLHDHPRRFISIGLRGSYYEITPTEGRTWRAPWIRTFPAEHIHRLSGPTPQVPCWTIVVVLRKSRPWGFWNRGEFIPWRRYLNMPAADERRSCR